MCVLIFGWVTSIILYCTSTSRKFIPNSQENLLLLIISYNYILPLEEAYCGGCGLIVLWCKLMANVRLTSWNSDETERQSFNMRSSQTKYYCIQHISVKAARKNIINTLLLQNKLSSVHSNIYPSSFFEDLELLLRATATITEKLPITIGVVFAAKIQEVLARD